jgi:glycerol-3-phosphate cytidylyltransferase-like family protein
VSSQLQHGCARRDRPKLALDCLTFRRSAALLLQTLVVSVQTTDNDIEKGGKPVKHEVDRSSSCLSLSTVADTAFDEGFLV